MKKNNNRFNLNYLKLRRLYAQSHFTLIAESKSHYKFIK